MAHCIYHYKGTSTDNLIISCTVWGLKLSITKVLLQCENLGLMAGIFMVQGCDRLLECMWLLVAYFEYITCMLNILQEITADQLSRNYMQSLFCSHPQISLLPAILTADGVLARTGLDFTSLFIISSYVT